MVKVRFIDSGEYGFTPLRRGTIKTLRNTLGGERKFTLLPPMDPSQCVHLDVNEGYQRCFNTAETGFLCQEHKDALDAAVQRDLSSRVVLPPVDKDLQVCQSIIVGDKRAIARGKKVRWEYLTVLEAWGLNS